MPQMLLRYGIDPDQLRVEMAEADAKTTQIEEGYDEMVESAKEKWTQWVQDWKGLLYKGEERAESMRKANPKFILRNYLLQQSIEKAEKGDFSMVEQLLERSKRPFDSVPDEDGILCADPPKKAMDICVSCSS